MTYTPTWMTWTWMKRRCGINKYSSEDVARLYAHVDFDPRWRRFEEFFKDMGERPSKKHSLDRIDNAKGYWKDNCRWALQREQAANRRTSIMVMLGGERLCLKEACSRVGMNYYAILDRMRRGRTFEQAVTKPLKSAERAHLLAAKLLSAT